MMPRLLLPCVAARIIINSIRLFIWKQGNNGWKGEGERLLQGFLHLSPWLTYLHSR